MELERRKSYEDRRRYYEPLYFSTGGVERRRARSDRRLDVKLRDPRLSGDQ